MLWVKSLRVYALGLQLGHVAHDAAGVGNRVRGLHNQLLQASGRSDITGLVEADRELNLAKAIETSNDGVEQRLDTLIEQFASLDLATRGRIEQLVVQTPDPVADTSRIVRDVAQLQTQGVNV